MNYLAHFLLSDGEPGLIVGNYLADNIRIGEVSDYPDFIRKGIDLHRFIDEFTDCHPAVKASVHRLRATQGRYAPVIVDVAYDLFLARNWERFTEIELQSFANVVYKALSEHQHLMPEKLQNRISVMISHNWLLGYSTIEGLDYVFQRMKSRLRFEHALDKAAYDVDAIAPQLESDFLSFFPELRAAAAAYVMQQASGF